MLILCNFVYRKALGISIIFVPWGIELLAKVG